MISTTGDFVGLSRTLLMFVTLNSKPRRTPKASTPLRTRDITMLRGTVFCASLISSPETNHEIGPRRAAPSRLLGEYLLIWHTPSNPVCQVSQRRQWHNSIPDL